MQAREIMTKHVESIGPETPVRDAALLMRASDVGFLPVLEVNRVVGAITDRDVVLRCVAAGRDPNTTPCRDVMTPDVFYCYEDQDIDDVAAEMRDRDVRRLIVLNRKNEVSGVVSLGDIAQIEGEQHVAGVTMKDIAEAA